MAGFFNGPRVHFSRTALAHAGKSGRRVVAAFIATAFAQDDAASARTQWRQVADQVRTKLPKLATLMDEAEEDVLASMTFPKEHRAKLHSTDEIDKSQCDPACRWPSSPVTVVQALTSIGSLPGIRDMNAPLRGAVPRSSPAAA